MKQPSDDLSELLSRLDFEPKFAIGIGKIENSNKFEEIIKRYGNFEKLLSFPNDPVERYFLGENQNLITISSLIPSLKYNLLFNVGTSRDSCSSELENYIKKTGIGLTKIKLNKNLQQEEIFIDNISQALYFYIGYKEYGPLFTTIYNTTVENDIKNKQRTK